MSRLVARSASAVGEDGRLARIHPAAHQGEPGAPYTYVTTKGFLSHFGFDTLRDLPDMEALEDAGLLNKDRLLAGDIPFGLMDGEEGDEADLDEDVDPDDMI